MEQSSESADQVQQNAVVQSDSFALAAVHKEAWTTARPPTSKPPELELGTGSTGTAVQSPNNQSPHHDMKPIVSINEDIEVHAAELRSVQTKGSFERSAGAPRQTHSHFANSENGGTRILRLDTLDSEQMQNKNKVEAPVAPEQAVVSAVLGDLIDLEKRPQQEKMERIQVKVRQKERGLRAVMSEKANLRDNTYKRRLHKLLNMVWFDFAIGVVIFINAIVIGIESEMRSQGQEPQDLAILVAADFFFLGIYSIELLLRLLAYGRIALANPWVRFDAFLVVIGYGEILLTHAYRRSPLLDKVMLVRILRLTRVARMVRFFTQFRVLWALVQGLIHSLNTLFWTFLLIFGLLYIFAIVSIDLLEDIDGREVDLSTQENEYNLAVKKFNQGLGHAMLTLAQFLTFDSIGLIYRPIILHQPILAIFFTTFVLVVSIALMNLVIAVMVESNIEQANEDRDVMRVQNEDKRKALLPKLKTLFRQLDEDGSGELDLMEIMNAPEETKAALQDIAKGLDIEEIFKMLDYDGGGRVDSDEFCEGLLKAAKQDKPLELLRLVHMSQEIMKNSREVASVLQALDVFIDEGALYNGNHFSKLNGKAPPDITKAVAMLNSEVASVQTRVGGMDDRLALMERNIQRIVRNLETPV